MSQTNKISLEEKVLLLNCVKIFVFALLREERDTEYAHRIQQEIQRAAEEERKREEKDEVQQNLHFPVCGRCLFSFFLGLTSHFHLSPAHIT